MTKIKITYFSCVGLFLLLFCISGVWADTVYLKNGTRVYGRIIKQNKEQVRIAVSVGTILLKTLDILSVRETEPDFYSAREEYNYRVKNIDQNEAADHFDLAVFCFKDELFDYAQKEFNKACALDASYKDETNDYLKKIECVEMFGLFFKHYDQRRYPEAVALLEKIRALYPGTDAAWQARCLLPKVKERERVKAPGPAAEKSSDYIPGQNGRADCLVYTSFGLKRTDEIAASLVSLLDSADEIIDIAFGSLDLARVGEAVIRALSRGVRVRLIVDDSCSSLQLIRLEKAGRDIVRRREGVNNLYLCIIDNRYIWLGLLSTMDMNLSFDLSAALGIYSWELGDLFSAEFKRLWDSGKKRDNKTILENIAVDTETVSVKTYFSSQSDLDKQIIEEISQAQESVLFCCVEFSDSNIAKALIKKHKQGLSIKGSFENKDNVSGRQYKAMVKAGLAVKIYASLAGLTINALIIDEEVVVISSAGLGRKSLSSGNAVLLVITDKNRDGRARTIARIFTKILTIIYSL